MNVLFIMKMKILMFIKWSYMFLLNMMTIEPRMDIIFHAPTPSILNTSLSGIRIWRHAKPHITQIYVYN